MNTVAVDPTTVEKLTENLRISQIRDEEGQVLGYFVPADMPHGATYLDSILTIETEKLEEIAKNPGTPRPMADVIAELESKEGSPECATQ